jgi:hypothetical protein
VEKMSDAEEPRTGGSLAPFTYLLPATRSVAPTGAAAVI